VQNELKDSAASLGLSFPTILAEATVFTYYHLKIFISIFFLSSVGGIAAALRSSKNVAVKDYISAALNSGIFGLIIGLLGWRLWGDQHLFFLIGFSALAGFGGTTLIDFAFQTWKRGFLLMMNQPPQAPEEEKEKK
jgi:hypothetical protein